MRNISLFLIGLLNFCAFSQTVRTFDVPLSREAMAFPSFTDARLYNSYNFCGSPAGIFELDTYRLRVHCGLDLLRLHAAGRQDSLKQQYFSWNAPDILFTVPKTFAARLFYAPARLVDETGAAQKLSLPLNRFGLMLAGQAPSGIFQFALNSKGYIGKEGLSGSPDNRTMMGLDDLTLSLGSRIHTLLAIGMRGGVTARFDTLYDAGSTINRDRYFSGHLPSLLGYLDFGKDSFPVQSVFSFAMATSRLLYVSGNDMDQNPLRGDSLALKWQVLGTLQHASGITFHPALTLSVWKNIWREYQPTVDNDDFTVGPELPGRQRQLSDFRFGFGTLIEVRRFASAWIEYTHPSMRLHYGDFWLPPRDVNGEYHRTSVGLKTCLHALPALGFPSSVEAIVRIGYFNHTENSGITPFGEEMFGLMAPVATYSQAYRYNPDFGGGRLQRVSGMTLGLTGTFLDKRLEADTHVCFLSRSGAAQSGGIAFGFDCAYVLR